MMKLNLENQLRKIIANDMTIKVIKLNRESTIDYQKMDSRKHSCPSAGSP
jgi:hypothetical protein